MFNKAINIYKSGMSPEELAAKVLEWCGYKYDDLPVPIDPFAIMRKCGIVYQFMNSKKLEGVYIVPEDDNDIPVVGINFNRPITRQRFSAAHELCHHLKDQHSQICPIGSMSTAIEKYAERFAAALLMPANTMRELALPYLNNGCIDLQGALLLSVRMGVSFSACARRLAYGLHLLPFSSSQELNRRLNKFKPDKVKMAQGIDREPIDLLEQAVNSYEFFYKISSDMTWYLFKNNFIFNENRMEGVDLDEYEVAEIVADLRLNGSASEYCSTEYDNIIQVTGHSSIYDFMLSTDEKIDVYKLMKLNRMLFQYTPNPDMAGGTRKYNVLVLGAKFETADWHDIMPRLIKLQSVVETTVNQVDTLSVSEYIEMVARIHHEITQIHPFSDGNGRCSRAFLNWMLRLKGLPPIYIKHENKEKYYEALSLADLEGEHKEIVRIIIKELFKTMMEINSR